MQWVTSPPEWYAAQTTPGVTYYGKATLDSGDPATLNNLSSWVALNSTRTLEWNQSGVGTLDGTYKIEIATDAAGNNIVATGYYRGLAEVDL